MGNNWAFGGTGGIAISGWREVNMRLSRLDQKIQTQINRKAVKAAIDPVVAMARMLCVEGKGEEAGLLKKSLGAVIRQRKGVVLAVAGPRSGFKVALGKVTRGPNKGATVYKNPTRYAHLVEFGTVHSAAKPFMTPAWNAVGADTALATYIKVFTQEVMTTPLP